MNKNQDSFKIIREEDYIWEINNTDDSQLKSLLIATLIETEFLKVKKNQRKKLRMDFK